MTYIPYLAEILPILRPNSAYVITNRSDQQEVVYDENNELPYPTEAELLAAQETYLAQKTATQYQRDRQPEYPSLADLAARDGYSGWRSRWYWVAVFCAR